MRRRCSTGYGDANDHGSNQLREATTIPIMLAVMPVESASESAMILTIFHVDIARPTKCRLARRERSGRWRDSNDAFGSSGHTKKSERRTSFPTHSDRCGGSSTGYRDDAMPAPLLRKHMRLG